METAGKTRLLQPTVARPLNGKIYLMNKQETGWASSAYEYESMTQLLEHWDVITVGNGSDSFGPFTRICNRTEV